MLAHFAALMTERDIAARLSTIILVPRKNSCAKRFVSVQPRTLEQSVKINAAAVDAVQKSDTNVRKNPAETYDNRFANNLKKRGFLKAIRGSEN